MALAKLAVVFAGKNLEELKILIGKLVHLSLESPPPPGPEAMESLQDYWDLYLLTLLLGLLGLLMLLRWAQAGLEAATVTSW